MVEEFYQERNSDNPGNYQERSSDNAGKVGYCFWVREGAQI